MSQLNPAGQAGLFKVMVRPARAVYLIAEGSRAGFRRAVQEATTRWGGACEPIVEVRADVTVDEVARLIVMTADVDGAVNVDAPRDLAVSAAGLFKRGLVSIDAIDRSGTTMFTSHPAVLALSPETTDGSNGYVIPGVDAALWQSAAAGDLTAEHEADFGPGFMVIRRARFDYEIGEAQLWGHTLLERTTASMGEYFASPAPMDSPTVIWVTRDDALSDCIGFWNLRALRSLRHGSMPMHLLPDDIGHWTTGPETLAGALRRPDRFTPDVLLTSATVDEDGLDAFAERMGLHRAADDKIRCSAGSDDVSMRAAPFTYLPTGPPLRLCSFERAYGEVVYVDVPVVREQTTLRFLSPVPLKSSSGGMALVRVAGEPLDALPKRECVARLVSRDATWRDEAIQLAVGLQRDWRLELRIPTLAAACEAVLAERTRSHELSHKGAIGAGLLSETGTDALADPDVYEAIRQLTTPRSKAIIREWEQRFGNGQPLTEEQKEFVAQFGGRSERRFRSAERLGHRTLQVALTALERLAGIGWAERGFDTKCDGCGLTSFVPFSSDIGRGPGRCPVCGMAADFTRTERGLTINYRLDGRVDHANDQGVVAHLMVIGAMSRRYAHTWLMPGVDMVFPDGTDREADVLGVCDSKLVSGEVKTSGDWFVDDQVEKDIDTAVRLGTDLYVMAATTPIPAQAQGLAKTRCAEHGIELLVLQRNDLQR